MRIFSRWVVAITTVAALSAGVSVASADTMDQVIPGTAGTASASGDVTPTAPELEAKKKTTKKATPKKSTNKASSSACERGVAKAIKRLGAPAGMKASCTSLSGFSRDTRGYTYLSNWDHASGRWTTSSIVVRNTLTETQAYHTMLHEIGHVRYYSAPMAKQKAALRAIGASDPQQGSYFNKPDERLAQSLTVYSGGGSWFKYKPVSKATAVAYYKALGYSM